MDKNKALEDQTLVLEGKMAEAEVNVSPAGSNRN